MRCRGMASTRNRNLSGMSLSYCCSRLGCSLRIIIVKRSLPLSKSRTVIVKMMMIMMVLVLMTLKVGRSNQMIFIKA